MSSPRLGRVLVVTTLTTLFAVFATACSKSEPTHGQDQAQPTTEPAKVHTGSTKSKDPAAARAEIAKGAVVVDVRTPGEYSDDHLAQAVNVPVDQLPSQLAEIDKLVDGHKDRPIVVYCASGHRAGKAKQELETAGYSHVINGGGLDDLR